MRHTQQLLIENDVAVNHLSAAYSNVTYREWCVTHVFAKVCNKERRYLKENAVCLGNQQHNNETFKTNRKSLQI